MRVVVLALLAAAPVIAAPAVPRLKAGLWEQTQTMSGMPVAVPPTTSRFCTDDAVQARMSMFAGSNGAGGQCSPPSIVPGGGSVTVDVECHLQGGMMSKVHAVARGDFNSNYTSDATMTLSGMPAGMPAGAMPRTMVSHTQARYAGACPAGMRPGDFNMNGRTFNVLDRLPPARP